MGSDLPRISEAARPQRLGIGMARAVQALVRAKGDWVQAATIAAAAWPEDPTIAATLRAAVGVGSLSGSTWGSQTVAQQTLVGEFVRASQAASVIGRLANVHRVPFHTRIARETLSPTAAWVGEAAPKVASELAYDAIQLEQFKAAGIVTISQELARSSAPSAEQLIRNSLVSAVGSFIDRQFLDPSVAATSAHPASLTSQVTPVVSSGTSASNAATDITALFDSLINGGNYELASPLLIMSPRTAVRLGLKRDTAGASAYANVRFSGGDIMGVPVLTSTSVGWSVSGGGLIALLDQNELVIADDGQVAIDVSGQAAVQLDSAPSSSASALTSLWQNNLVGIRAERAISWTTRHAPAAAIAYVDATAY